MKLRRKFLRIRPGAGGSGSLKMQIDTALDAGDNKDAIISTTSLEDVSGIDLKVAPRLCLNMIVKNEGAIIERSLRAIAPW